MHSPIQHLYKHTPSTGSMFYAWFPAMHTRVDLVFCDGRDEGELLQVAAAVYREITRLEKLGNYYDPESELARLNRTSAVCPQAVSHELYEILTFCMDCHKRTCGCFDVTVLSENYTPGFANHILLSPKEHTLFFMRRGITIDLSGFLKGYALDRIRDILRCHEIRNALVNMGNSSVLASGNFPLAEGWKVGFGAEDSSSKEKAESVLLKNECLTTSGNRNAGRKHIISPFTGTWVEGKRKVAVVTANGTEGEVLSTALFVADTARRKQIEAAFSPRLILDFQ